MSFVLGIADISPEVDSDKHMDESPRKLVNTKAQLFDEMTNVLMSLHLLYEDSKLNKFYWKGCPILASFLSRISADLNLTDFVRHYWQDFPTICHMSPYDAKTHQINQEILANLPKLDQEPPNIFKSLHEILDGKCPTHKFPIIRGVTSKTMDILLVFALFSSGEKLVEPLNFCTDFNHNSELCPKPFEHDPKLGNSGRIIEYIISCGYNSWTVQSIPIGFAIPILASIYECRLSPPVLTWKPEAYDLIGKH